MSKIVRCTKCGSTDIEVALRINQKEHDLTKPLPLPDDMIDIDSCSCNYCGNSEDNFISEDNMDSNANYIELINDWWKYRDGEDLEVITGLESDNFESDEAYTKACNAIWEAKTDEQKIEIYQTIQYRE